LSLNRYCNNFSEIYIIISARFNFFEFNLFEFNFSLEYSNFSEFPFVRGSIFSYSNFLGRWYVEFQSSQKYIRDLVFRRLKCLEFEFVTVTMFLIWISFIAFSRRDSLFPPTRGLSSSSSQVSISLDTVFFSEYPIFHKSSFFLRLPNLSEFLFYWASQPYSETFLIFKEYLCRLARTHKYSLTDVVGLKCSLKRKKKLRNVLVYGCQLPVRNCSSPEMHRE